jgi:hypothetical protein
VIVEFGSRTRLLGFKTKRKLTEAELKEAVEGFLEDLADVQQSLFVNLANRLHHPDGDLAQHIWRIEQRG